MLVVPPAVGDGCTKAGTVGKILSYLQTVDVGTGAGKRTAATDELVAWLGW